jgi:hypothetical protein
VKKKSQWGKKKSNPYTPVDIDEPNTNIQIYQPTKQTITKRKQEAVNKFNSRDWDQKKKIVDRLNKVREKKKRGKEDKRGVLIIKDYMVHLHNKYGGGTNTPMEVHHWMPKSRIRHNDFFVCCLSPDEHYQIHHGGGSVNAFIEERGMENLLMDSAIMFAEWLGTESGQRNRYSKIFTAMIQDIRIEPSNYDHVLETTRRYAEEIRLLRR